MKRFGFWIEFAVAETVQIQVAPMLRRSPHVLYTNVIEPILRWLCAHHGYVLVHGAALSSKWGGFLITAKTDTGKTTTVLRLLDRDEALSFLSDDLTLLAPDGTMLSYPKPLTISRHTLAATPTARLTPRERLVLPLQSRIHSRGGRRIAHLLAGTRLPMATVNAVTQFLIPPPKYQIDRLVPGVRVVRDDRLTGIFVIERGSEDRELRITGDEALDRLMANTGDAFGFPPYRELEPFLRSLYGVDLRKREREIVASALAGVPACRIVSSTLNWAERITRHALPARD